MPAIEEKPKVNASFNLTSTYNPVVKGAITLMLPEMAGAISYTALPVVGETSSTLLPEYGEFSTTYPLGQRHES